jgi:maleylacetoacetate isomerase/maleylpyruvate isomerase
MRIVKPPKDVAAPTPVQIAGTVKLYTWWRSQASFRVRIALLLKGLEAQMIFVDLLQGQQFAESYRRLNPEMVLPTLIDGDGPPLVQSLAILEYLDERYPEPTLLPKDIRARAHVRALSQSVAVDAHPFVVPRVRKYLEQELGVDEAKRMKWIRHWLDSGTRVLEQQLARDPRTGRFCYGDTPTLADVCLVPHITSAKMLYDCDLSPYPTVQRIFETCMQLDAFARAHPIQQADAAKAVG